MMGSRLTDGLERVIMLYWFPIDVDITRDGYAPARQVGEVR
jgi:hypothetical protein